MDQDNKKQIVWAVGMLSLVLVVIFGFVYFSKKDTSVGASMDTFAKCLASKDLTMYGAAWCSHCVNQKKAFGESVKYINYVECPDNVDLCASKGINGYPTWVDGSGKKHEGEQSLETLAQISGCELTK